MDLKDMMDGLRKNSYKNAVIGQELLLFMEWRLAGEFLMFSFREINGIIKKCGESWGIISIPTDALIQFSSALTTSSYYICFQKQKKSNLNTFISFQSIIMFK